MPGGGLRMKMNTCSTKQAQSAFIPLLALISCMLTIQANEWSSQGEMMSHARVIYVNSALSVFEVQFTQLYLVFTPSSFHLLVVKTITAAGRHVSVGHQIWMVLQLHIPRQCTFSLNIRRLRLILCTFFYCVVQTSLTFCDSNF